MKGRLFGTDGIRGKAGEEPLTLEFLERLGRLFSEHLPPASGNPASRGILIGHDGRQSGETLAAALAGGLVRGGVPVDVVGLAPTPAVAYLTATGLYAGGVVISASHNPAEDNGIKLLGADGCKLSDGKELVLEEGMAGSEDLPDSAVPGTIRRAKGLVGDYMAWLRNEAFPNLELKGWKILIDCANGAYSQLGPRILKAFGAEPVPIHNRPDGRNINRDCGSLHPELAARETVRNGCRIGVSLDGDGDRGILVDGNGRVLDGDLLLAGLAPHLAARGLLPERTLVATVMSNLGLEKFLEKEHIHLERVAVGDRNVARAMRQNGWALGGEKSGHILFGEDHGFRGDGLYTFLRIAAALTAEGLEPHEFAAGYREFPQKLVSLPVVQRVPLERLTRLQAVENELAREFGGSGRTVVRFSGTELRLRLMVEADSDPAVLAALERLTEAARADGILV